MLRAVSAALLHNVTISCSSYANSTHESAIVLSRAMSMALATTQAIASAFERSLTVCSIMLHSETPVTGHAADISPVSPGLVETWGPSSKVDRVATIPSFWDFVCEPFFVKVLVVDVELKQEWWNRPKIQSELTSGNISHPEQVL